MASSTIQRSDWKVIVADDDDDWRSLMALTLRRAGFAVSEASDGDQLVACCRALLSGESRGVLVVSDLEMGGCDGLEAAAQIRSMSARIPVLLVTGTHETHIEEAGREAGVQRILFKPVNPDDLLTAVRALQSSPGFEPSPKN